MLMLSNESSAINFTEYSLVSFLLQTNIRSPFLTPYKTQLQSCHLELKNLPKYQFEKATGSLLHQSQSQIADKLYKLQLFKLSEASYLLKANDEQFQITKNHIVCSHNKPDVSLLLGPALIFNLALNSVFCFHASAFTYKNRLFMVLANSGVGKSTIARFMSQQNKATRVADDIVALSLVSQSFKVFPRFPQLKLNLEHQPLRQEIQQTPTLLFAEKSSQSSSLKPMSSILALKKLISHSVASRLFDKEQLAIHTGFCQKLSQKASSYQLMYQQNTKGLEAFKEQIDELF